MNIKCLNTGIFVCSLVVFLSVPAHAIMNGQGQDVITAPAVFQSSATIAAPLGLGVTYGISAGTITLSNGITASSITLTSDAEVRGAAKLRMGTGTGLAKAIGLASVNTNSQSTTGTVEEVLMSYTLPANSLSGDGKGIKIRAWGSTVADTDPKVASIRFGGTDISGTILATASTSVTGAKWELEVLLFRTSEDNQKSIGRGTAGTVAQNVLINPTIEDDASTILIALTGTTSSTTGDLTAEGLVVEFIN